MSKEAPKELLDRLKAIADLNTGDMLPEWLFNDGTWSEGMSKLLYEAIGEIKYLRGLTDDRR